MTHLQAAARSMLPLVFLGVCAQPFLKNSMPFPLHVLFVWAVITFAAFGFGHILLTAFRTPFAPGLESLVLKLGIGFGVLSYFTFWGGLMNWIYIWFFWVLLPMTLVTFCTTNAPWRTHGATSWERGEKILLFILLPMVLVNFYLALAPPTARDVLTQHLAIPKLYIQHHGIYNLPFLEASYNPMQLDMVYILSLLLGSEESASLIHFTFALMTGSLIYLLLSRFGPRWFAWITALLFLSTPMVFSLSSKAYVDLGLTFYSFAAIYGIVQTDNKKKWLSVSAIFVGLAAASKYNGFLVVIILCFWATLEAKEGGFGAALGQGLKYFLIALAVVSPWLIRNYFYSGNPIFPFLSDRMGNLIPIERESYSILTQRMLLYGENWMDFFAIPFRLFFQGEDESPRFFDGILNPVFLLLSPLAFWGNSDKWKFRMAGFVVLYFIFSLFLVEMRTRYVLPTLGPLAVLTGLGWARLRALRQGRLWAAIPFIFFFLNASYMLSYAQKADIGPYILGKESREDYLSRKLSDFDLWQYANGHLPENSRVMMYFMGNRGYYSDREYCYESFYSGKQLKQALSRSPSVESLGRYFREKGITHIAWRVDLFTSFIDSNLLPREKAAFDEFVLRHLTLVFEAKGYQLLRVKGESDAPSL